MCKPFALLRRNKEIEILYNRTDWSPGQIGNTTGQTVGNVITQGPIRILAVIRRAAPLPGSIVYPKSTVGGMPGCQNCSVGIRGNAVHQSPSSGSHLQLIGDGRNIQRHRRVLLGSQPSLARRIVYAIHRTQGLTVHPMLAHDSIIVRHGARHDTRHCRSTVYVGKRIGGIHIATPVAHHLIETSGSEKRRKGFHIVRTQLVYRHVDHQPGDRMRRLGFHIGPSQHHNQRSQKTIAFRMHGLLIFLFFDSLSNSYTNVATKLRPKVQLPHKNLVVSGQKKT